MHAGELGGDVETPFAPVREVFAEVIADQAGTGAALCAYVGGRGGHAVIDLWGGWADAARTKPWRHDSICMPYSVSKPVAAMCALKLIDDGRLELDAPVQRYWPEFTAQASVRHVLSHQAGVVALDEPAAVDLFFDWDGMCAALARQGPTWPPGEAHGESALFYGHLVGELVRRVDGRDIGTFLRHEIGDPLGIDFHFGLSDDEHGRAVELTNLESLSGPAVYEGRPPLYAQAISNPPGGRDATVVNSRRWRSAQIPAVNGHGTARALAAFYQALLDGRLLSTDLMAEATRAQCSGPDRVFGADTAWGLGFGVEDEGFGMGGLGGNYAGVSVKGGYVIAFVTGTVGSYHPVERLENEIRRCLGLPPLPQ